MCEGDQSTNLHQDVFTVQTMVDVTPCGYIDVTQA